MVLMFICWFEFYFEYYVYDCDDVFMELVYILDGGYM